MRTTVLMEAATKGSVAIERVRSVGAEAWLLVCMVRPPHPCLVPCTSRAVLLAQIDPKGTIPFLITPLEGGRDGAAVAGSREGRGLCLLGDTAREVRVGTTADPNGGRPLDLPSLSSHAVSLVGAFFPLAENEGKGEIKVDTHT